VKSIDAIGLSRSNQWKNLQGPVAAVLGLVVLSEYTTTKPIFVLLAGLAVFVSAVCFTVSSSREEAKSNMTGVYLASLSALGFGTTAVIQKYITTHVGVYSQQVVFSLSIALSIALYTLLTKKNLPRLQLTKPSVRSAFGAGILYLGASFFQLQSYRHLPASIAFTVIQLNTVWTIAIGIFIFKEIPVKKYYQRLVLGMIFALAGIGFLAVARK
jgi:glucose uptake protein GlcU